MRNNLKYLILVSGVMLSCSAVAESASDKLTRIEAETLVLKAREKQLDVQASIITRQNEIAMKQTLNEQLTQNAVSGEPVVRSVEGIGKALYATLQLNNGTLVDARVGDMLPNGMRVVSIAPNEVLVERRKQRRRLANGMQGQPDFNPDYPGPGVGLPPLPPSVPRGTAR